MILFYFGVERYQGLGEGWSKFMSVLQSIIIGFGLAFLMNPIMEFFERHMYPFFAKHCKTEEKCQKDHAYAHIFDRTGHCGWYYCIVLCCDHTAVIPDHPLSGHTHQRTDRWCLGLGNQITGGRYEKNIMSAKGSNLDKAIDKGVKWLENYIDVSTKDVISVAVTGALGVGRLLVNCIIGIIVSVYVLCSKETFKGQAKKLIYGIFRADQANVILEIGRKTRDIFYGFIIGKIIDSAIIGVICYVCMLIFKMPYPLLVSIIIGVTNIIPVFGPYIGALPTVIIIFLTEPMQGIYFLIFIIVLQQIDGNIIGPKILGDSTGLSSFWVVVAIVVGGGLFGFAGMLFGVPTMALIYYLVGRFSKHMLRKRDLPEETADYINMERVNEADHTLVEHTKEYEEESHVKVNVFFKKEEKTIF